MLNLTIKQKFHCTKGVIKMKALSQFQCEICNTIYKSKSECQNCESTHQRPRMIVYNKFNSYKNDGKYPNYIDVEMADGKTMRYKR